MIQAIQFDTDYSANTCDVVDSVKFVMVQQANNASPEGGRISPANQPLPPWYFFLSYGVVYVDRTCPDLIATTPRHPQIAFI